MQIVIGLNDVGVMITKRFISAIIALEDIDWLLLGIPRHKTGKNGGCFSAEQRWLQLNVQSCIQSWIHQQGICSHDPKLLLLRVVNNSQLPCCTLLLISFALLRLGLQNNRKNSRKKLLDLESIHFWCSQRPCFFTCQTGPIFFGVKISNFKC